MLGKMRPLSCDRFVLWARLSASRTQKGDFPGEYDQRTAQYPNGLKPSIPRSNI